MNICISYSDLSSSGTNTSIGDKWAAEISAEVKRAVSVAFDSKHGRRSTMSFTGEEQTIYHTSSLPHLIFYPIPAYPIHLILFVMIFSDFF